MKSVLPIFALFLLVSCGKQGIKKENELVKEISKNEILEKNPIIFKKINFSIAGYSKDKRSKDFEITASDSIYYRTRVRERILENFTAKLNSKDKQILIEMLDSLNFNVIKFGNEYDVFDEVRYSLIVNFKNGEVRMGGPLTPYNHGKKIFNLLKFVERQDLQPSKNRRFITAKDVFLSQPLPNDSL